MQGGVRRFTADPDFFTKKINAFDFQGIVVEIRTATQDDDNKVQKSRQRVSLQPLVSGLVPCFSRALIGPPDFYLRLDDGLQLVDQGDYCGCRSFQRIAG